MKSPLKHTLMGSQLGGEDLASLLPHAGKKESPESLDQLWTGTLHSWMLWPVLPYAAGAVTHTPGGYGPPRGTYHLDVASSLLSHLALLLAVAAELFLHWTSAQPWTKQTESSVDGLALPQVVRRYSKMRRAYNMGCFNRGDQCRWAPDRERVNVSGIPESGCSFQFPPSRKSSQQYSPKAQAAAGELCNIACCFLWARSSFHKANQEANQGTERAKISPEKQLRQPLTTQMLVLAWGRAA